MVKPEFKYKKVLLIEDVEVDQTIVEAELRIVAPKAGLTKFFNCNTALDYLKNAKKNEMPDLLIADMKLPGMSLLEFLGHLKKLLIEKKVICPVIVYSAYFGFEREAVKKIKANPLVIAMLEKPIDLEVWAELGMEFPT